MHARVHKVLSCISITWGQGRNLHYIPTDSNSFKLLVVQLVSAGSVASNWFQKLPTDCNSLLLLVTTKVNWLYLVSIDFSYCFWKPTTDFFIDFSCSSCNWFLLVPTSCNSFNLCLMPFLYLLNFDFDHHLKQENNSRTKLMFLIFTDSSRPTWEPA